MILAGILIAVCAILAPTMAAAQDTFSVSAPATATAGNSFSFTVTALTPGNTVDTSYAGTVQFTTTDTGAGVVLPANYTFQPSDAGVHTFANGATLVTAGTQTITATDSTNNITGTSGLIAVTANAATHFSVSAPTTATSGSAFNFTVTALDQFNNIATGYNGTAHFTSTDASASLPADYTFVPGDAGVHTFSATLATSGNQTIMATDTVTPSITGTSNTITDNTGPPSISKQFLPSQISQGTSTLLSFTLKNPNSDLNFTGVSFADTLPSGLVVASPNDLANSCGGTVTATSGSGSVTLASGTIAPLSENGGECTISLAVTAASANTYSNTTGAISANQAEGGTSNTAVLTVTSSSPSASPPTISKLFLPNSITLGGSTLLSFTLENPNNVMLTGVSFTDALPAGLAVATPNGLSNSCGGTATAIAGSTSITLTGGTLSSAANEGGGACFISVEVMPASTGAFNNMTGAISANESGAGTTSNMATLTVTSPVTPTISKSFGTNSIAVGVSTTLSFVISNPNAGPLTGVAFTDSLPAGLFVSTPNGLNNNCGGTVTAMPGSTSISLTGGMLGAANSDGPGACTISLLVTGAAVGTQNNTTGPIMSAQTSPGSPSNTATISVTQGSSITSVVSSSNPSAFSQAVTFTATVSGGGVTPTGMVQFVIDGSNFGSPVTLSNGMASLTTSALTLGNHTITDSYGGDANYTGSSGSLIGNPQVVVGAPTVLSLAPNAGPLSGGTSVTITGTNFAGVTAVNFGSVPATAFTVNTPSQITATSPPEAAGTVDVRVTTPAGTSAINPGDQFIYTNGPTVSAVSPKGGPTAGGTTVTISGANLNGVTVVNFGSTAAASFTVNSPTQITATSPPESAGTVHISVTSPGGTSPTSAADQFTFGTVPAVTAVLPANGPTLGGTTVTIMGTSLAGATAVNFGGTAATTFTVNSPTSITATAPNGIGTVDVTVTTVIGTSPTSAADRYSYEPSHDFNGDGKSDILWRDTSSNIGMWLMNGTSILQNKVLGTLPDTWAAVGQRDFNDDGKSDVLWRDTLGNVGFWLMNGTQIASTTVLGLVPTTWSVAGTGDFNADGKGDIVWRDSKGNVGIWLMNGTSVLQTATIGNVPTNWMIAGADMKGEIFWRNLTTGEVGIWLVSGTTIVQSVDFGVAPLTWTIAGLGDFDGNGSTDILWRDSSGNVVIWLLNGLQVMSSTVLGNVPLTWSIAETGDFNGDGKSDILWIDTSGNVAAWFMNGTSISSTTIYGNVGTTWSVQSLNAD